MSESLNRAFIRAYGKEKTSEAKRKATAAEIESQQVSDWILRIDTTSVPIPSPHLFAAKPAVRPLPVAVQAPPALGAAAQAEIQQTNENSEAALRSSIATQMLKAGGWQDQQIDAYIGGFPMISPLYASNSHDAASDQPKPAAGTTSAEEKTPIPPSQENSAEKSMVRPPLIAPEEPALTHPAVAAAESASIDKTTDSAEASGAGERPPRTKNLPKADKLAQRNRDGEIFRLDRPSYTTQFPAVSETEHRADDDNADSSNESDLSGSLTNVDMRLRGTRPEPQNNSLDAQTRRPKTQQPLAAKNTQAMERELRRARMRIFNPVWEVDNFQWPAVCLELLNTMTKNMSSVANNLISACEEGLQILAVTSPQSGEGSTTVACCLALLAGTHGLNVAIVDGDIENPTLSYQTNLDVDQDWRVAILNQLPLEDIAVHSIDDQVTLVPLLTPIAANEMSTDDDRIALMLQELSASFDLVIVDMGTMNTARNLVTSMGEQGIISAAVAVVDYRSSTPQRVEDCLRRIRQSGIASIGLVENFAA